jgi:hypothetical protein
LSPQQPLFSKLAVASQRQTHPFHVGKERLYQTESLYSLETLSERGGSGAVIRTEFTTAKLTFLLSSPLLHGCLHTGVDASQISTLCYWLMFNCHEAPEGASQGSLKQASGLQATMLWIVQLRVAVCG